MISRSNGGVSAARMTGVGETTAEYVFPLDSDDRIVPGALAALWMPSGGTRTRALPLGTSRSSVTSAGSGARPSGSSLWQETWANFIPIASMVRRSALLEVGGWEITTGFEDWDLWLKLGEAGWAGSRSPGSSTTGACTGAKARRFLEPPPADAQAVAQASPSELRSAAGAGQGGGHPARQAPRLPRDLRDSQPQPAPLPARAGPASPQHAAEPS